MLLSSMTDRGSTPVLINTLVFNQNRLKMIAENIANIHTPGYRTKQLDTAAFQGALREALDVRKRNPKAPFVVRSGNEVRTDRFGSLSVTPSDRPVDNILYHDGTNLSIERQMADLAETGMTHRLAATLLRRNFDSVRKAIRGTVV